LKNKTATAQDNTSFCPEQHSFSSHHRLSFNT